MKTKDRNIKKKGGKDSKESKNKMGNRGQEREGKRWRKKEEKIVLDPDLQLNDYNIYL